MNKLFHIQDSDRPAWVIAPDWATALDKWRTIIIAENALENEMPDPDGIQLVCGPEDLVIGDNFEELLVNTRHV